MVVIQKFGQMSTGEDVYCATLRDDVGNEAVFLNYGATMQSLRVALSSGLRDICLGYDSVKEYETNTGCFGGIVGRCVNRIKPPEVYLQDKRYLLDENRPGMHIHGGNVGFHQKSWSMEYDNDAVVFHLHSPDGEGGYPGNLNVELRISFVKSGVLEMRYAAHTDQTTIINLTNHSYFNLNGHNSGDARSQKLQI